MEEECFNIKTSEEYSNYSLIYALKFLTYTKNIKAILDKNKNEIEVNKESMTYIIKHNEYSKICFYLNNSSEIRSSLSIEI